MGNLRISENYQDLLRNQQEDLGITENSRNLCSDWRTSDRYLVLLTVTLVLTTFFRVFLGLGGSYGGNSPRLFLLMSSSPPCSSQVSWVTGVGPSSVDRSNLRMLWLYLDGSYFMVRALPPF